MTTQPTAAEANRIFYRDEAMAYEATEECVRGEAYQRRLREALDDTLTRLGPQPRVLDACGGTGNVGVALHERGITPVVVDLSAEMTAIWRAKAERLGVAAEIHEAHIEDYLRDDSRTWDLITFSSALHHLEDFAGVLIAAAAKLAPGGMLFTMFDPTLSDRRIRVLRRLDFVIWLARTRPSRFVELLVGAVRRAVRPPQGAHIGRMAERYAYSGIDDEALVAVMRSHGLEVIVHERYYDARAGLFRFLLRRMDRPSSFRLLLRRPA
ncbi:MAG: hypothetical protein QOG42_1887 [Solirubrobacteraceae bacterium]|nr:hypothetical protein [Solirubrobacteraceae bacterium]